MTTRRGNGTRWPWYAHLATVSWLVSDDVNRGRQAVNFSEWNPRVMKRYKLHKVIERVVSDDSMPPANCLRLHPDARLTQEEKLALIEGFNRTIASAAVTN